MIIFRHRKMTMALNRKLALNLIAAVTMLTGAKIYSQNSVTLQMRDGSPFTVFIGDSAVNKKPESHVRLQGIKQDTLQLKVGVQSGTKFDLTLYLLDKGKKTSGKEFNFLVQPQKFRMVALFMGMRDE